jgi:glycosyltransferase involved in cell wall biosynthesis
MSSDLIGQDNRPFAFLVSTTPCARVIRTNLGSSAYSYYFVLEALAPVLEELGTWQLIDQPASSLAFAAARAVSEGFRPIHLAINPPQDCYLSPALPNVIFPFWEFPDLPSEDFQYDTRQNWIRACRPASAILTACRFTAGAFLRAGVRCPVSVVPVPLDPTFEELPAWKATRSWTLVCRHETWGGDSVSVDEADGMHPAHIERDDTQHGLRGRVMTAARVGFRKATWRMDPFNVQKIIRIKQILTKVRVRSTVKLAYLGLRESYRRHVRPWLSDEAVKRMTRVKERALRALGRGPADFEPALPSEPLTLSGLVYLSVLNVGDMRKNWMDLVSGFLTAFRDRSDVTLVLKLVTSPHRESLEVKLLRDFYKKLGFDHKCRMVIVTDYLDEEQLAGLYQAATYYVNTSHAEGACLPLMRALAGGRPAIAPDHTALADYMDDAVGFVIRSHPEPAYLPHDPDKKLITTRYRLVWSDILESFRESAGLVDEDRSRYFALADAARYRMVEHASRSVVREALKSALRGVPNHEVGGFAWASENDGATSSSFNASAPLTLA